MAFDPPSRFRKIILQFVFGKRPKNLHERPKSGLYFFIENDPPPPPPPFAKELKLIRGSWGINWGPFQGSGAKSKAHSGQYFDLP